MTLSIDKEAMRAEGGRLITQGLFIDFSYDTKFAQYTWQDQDKEYRDHTYPSLKRLYIEYADVHEYAFANEYLLGWNHWKRLCSGVLKSHVELWREELNLSMMSEGFRNIVDQAEKSYQASKFLADRGWETKKMGRPTKEEKQAQLEMVNRIEGEYNKDVARMEDYKKNAK